VKLILSILFEAIGLVLIGYLIGRLHANILERRWLRKLSGAVHNSASNGRRRLEPEPGQISVSDRP
jgi:hypothetical protein